MTAVNATIPRDMHDPKAALLAAFHAADPRGRSAILEFALSTAEDWPGLRAAATPSARLDQLITQAGDLSAMLATAPVMQGDEQVEFLLDCSSLADDFARNLDKFVGGPQ